ncbi:Condensin complex subunit 2 [Tupaia chinensis]|uniref:Condensin complex subunit 2 n=1 Tax=Tupaia chinensis TaxID=246437 RepID=L9KF52_TUPCH|nr:Condensin complex subunit 2 [Tupaia chinensis]
MDISKNDDHRFQFTKWDIEIHNESVSVLVDKFKKNDQVFEIYAEVEESDCEDFPDGALKEHKKKSTRKDFEIDFEDDMDFDVWFHKTKAATGLTKFTLENQNWRVTTLPIDFDNAVPSLIQLHPKTGIRLLKTAKGKKRAETKHYEEIGDYDYNSPNDTFNFCPGLQAADSDYGVRYCGTSWVLHPHALSLPFV